MNRLRSWPNAATETVVRPSRSLRTIRLDAERTQNRAVRHLADGRVRGAAAAVALRRRTSTPFEFRITAVRTAAAALNGAPHPTGRSDPDISDSSRLVLRGESEPPRIQPLNSNIRRDCLAPGERGGSSFAYSLLHRRTRRDGHSGRARTPCACPEHRPLRGAAARKPRGARGGAGRGSRVRPGTRGSGPRTSCAQPGRDSVSGGHGLLAHSQDQAGLAGRRTGQQ